MGVKYFEQRINMKFLFRLGRKPTRIFDMLKQVFWEEVILRAGAFGWYKWLSDGRNEVEFVSIRIG